MIITATDDGYEFLKPRTYKLLKNKLVQRNFLDTRWRFEVHFDDMLAHGLRSAQIYDETGSSQGLIRVDVEVAKRRIGCATFSRPVFAQIMKAIRQYKKDNA